MRVSEPSRQLLLMMLEEGGKLELLLGGPAFETDKELVSVVKGGEREFAVVEERTLGLSEEDPADVEFKFCAKVEPLCVPGPGM